MIRSVIKTPVLACFGADMSRYMISGGSTDSRISRTMSKVSMGLQVLG